MSFQRLMDADVRISRAGAQRVKVIFGHGSSLGASLRMRARHCENGRRTLRQGVWKADDPQIITRGVPVGENSDPLPWSKCDPGVAGIAAINEDLLARQREQPGKAGHPPVTGAVKTVGDWILKANARLAHGLRANAVLRSARTAMGQCSDSHSTVSGSRA